MSDEARLVFDARVIYGREVVATKDAPARVANALFNDFVIAARERGYYYDYGAVMLSLQPPNTRSVRFRCAKGFEFAGEGVYSETGQVWGLYYRKAVRASWMLRENFRLTGPADSALPNAGEDPQPRN